MKIISPKVHAFLDFLTIIFFMVSPSLFPLSDVAAHSCYLLSGIHLLLTITTQNVGGLFRIIPFRIHGLIEVLVSIFFGVIALTYFRYHSADQLFFASLCLVFLIVFILTDFKARFK